MTVQDWLGADNTIGIDIWERKYRNENETFDEWVERVSGGSEEVKDLILKKKFLFGGRILANRGLAQDKKITYSNCFTGDTKIFTDYGIQELKNLVDIDGIKVFSYGSFRNAEFRSFGNQDIYELRLKKGNTKKIVKVTGDHIWLVVNNETGRFSEIKTLDLTPGMKLANSTSKCYRTYKPSPFGVAHGFHFGDGDHATKRCLRTNICEGKEELIPYFTPDVVGQSGKVKTISGVPHFFNEVPSLKESPAYLYGWLAGYFAADGSVDNRGQCTICSCVKANLEYVKDVLCVLGLPSGVIRKQDRISNLNGKLGTVYILNLNKHYLNENFFILSKHRERFLSTETRPLENWIVESVSDVIGNEEVFCAIEPEHNAFTLDNNILTHNCYVLSPPEDNLESIFDTAKKLARTYSYGGGVGIDISKLAPNGAIVNNAAKKSSGAVSFMDLYSLVTGLISQNGRRGALMLSMAVDHPDIKEFIDIKKDLDRVTKANTSIRVSDKFMTAVLDDDIFKLSFTRKETGETTEETVKARDIFNRIAENNWDMGEPGVLFWDEISKWNMLSEFDDFEYAGTNPCAEEPLPAGGSCLLGSINLSAFVDDNGNIDFEDLAETAYQATVALNDVLDEGLQLHPLEEQRNSVRDWRQIGLGIFGLADMFIKMGVRYGSDESIDISRHVGHTILNNAVLASTNLAAKDGPFPKFRLECLEKSEFYQTNIDDWIKEYIREHGIRNSQFLTIAPTGTLSSMIGVSGGIEPIFANYYDRRTESLHDEEKIFRIWTPIVKDYMQKLGLSEENELPDFFVTAHDIKPYRRILVQSAWQENVDASISSTINLPESATVEEVAQIYKDAWYNDLKGVTVFRNNCRRTGILTTVKDESKNENKASKTNDIPRGFILNASDNLVGKKRKLITGCGSLHCTAFFDPVSGDLLETYLSKGSQGGCNNFMIGLSRMISLAARGGCGIESIIDQLLSCGVCPSYAVRRATKHDTSVGSCCPVAIANALKEMWEEMQNDICDGNWNGEEHTEKETVADSEENNKDICPECGEPIYHEGGCDVCKSCGWSKCG